MQQRSNDSHLYDDIIHLPHHVSSVHPHMSMRDRAAQFAPFSALNGHSAAIRETARLTDQRVELDETEADLLNEKIMLLQERLDEEPAAAFTWFVPDIRKEGGSYRTLSGRVKKILPFENTVIMANGFRIPLDEIIEIEILK